MGGETIARPRRKADASKGWNRLDAEAIRRGLWDKPRAEVRSELAELYQPFVHNVAGYKLTKNPRLDFDDVLQECNIGLLSAIDRFDPANVNGASFSTFAGNRIRFQAEEASRSADWCSHKARDADKELRARALAGDETVRHCDLIPEMHTATFSTSLTAVKAGEAAMDPEARPEGSALEDAATKLEAILTAADPVIARYTRDVLEVMHAPPERFDSRHRNDLTGTLAKKWGTTPEGAGAIYRSCIESLKAVAV